MSSIKENQNWKTIPINSFRIIARQQKCAILKFIPVYVVVLSYIHRFPEFHVFELNSEI